uniref:sterol 22-desaturase n=1 Tax=Araucaria cunninghamii TaxID=56994 RepID=A0A0D6R5R9_ARACU
MRNCLRWFNFLWTIYILILSYSLVILFHAQMDMSHVFWFFPTLSITWHFVIAAMVALFIAWQQVIYLKKKSSIPGPSLVIPFLGGAIEMVANPTKFWDDQSKAARNFGLAGNFLLGNFIVFIRDSELCHKIFANVKPDVFHLIGHPFGKKLFGEHNLIYMFGEEHRQLRRRFAPNFTLKALGVYVAIQENDIRKHISKWIEICSSNNNKPIALRTLCRDMNLETSQNVFVGPYLSEEAREQFNRDYTLFNTGLMALPIDLPGFAFYKARHAVSRLARTLAECARQSKKTMESGKEASCLVDFFMVDTLREIREANERGAPMPAHTDEIEMGGYIFDFLFAAQDASTSSLVWAITLLESHPKILEKVREEQIRIRPDLDAPIFAEQLREMKYTEMVVKEVIRFRPPATMVPHIAAVDFPITENYIIPKGTIVFPSLFESSFQGFTDPHKFDPERFSPCRQEDQVYKRNWLPFGAGPHQCVGQRYAVNHLMLFVALFSTSVDCTRCRTPDCDEIAYMPTIVPKDEFLVYLSRRTKTA